jgi:hypothetical protein
VIDAGKLAAMTEWASRFGCTIQVNGEVGFGRPCVGILHGQAYVDYDWDLFGPGGGAFWTPEDAYHKHDCLAVLVYDDDYDKALEQLWEWVQYMIAEHLGITTQVRETYNTDGVGRALELLMGGHTQAKVVRLEP